jgi:hypothetical protein
MQWWDLDQVQKVGHLNMAVSGPVFESAKRTERARHSPGCPYLGVNLRASESGPFSG